MKEKKSFILRIDQSTYHLLEKWAVDEFRSVNGQIEYLLQQALVESGRKRSKGSEGMAGSKSKQPGQE